MNKLEAEELVMDRKTLSSQKLAEKETAGQHVSKANNGRKNKTNRLMVGQNEKTG